MNDQIVNKELSYEIMPCEQIADIDNKSGFKKLGLTSAQKIQIGGLLQQMPAIVAADTLSKAYIVRFPDGIPNVLTPLKQGGLGGMVKGENGRFVGSASLYSTEVQATVLSAFNVMSIVSGQYFLSQINNELSVINQNIDKILEFLYGDKKAELLAEVSFAKYAYENYSSIMEHEQQRLATLVSLQESKKVAVKDIEFYISDLSSIVKPKDLSVIKEAFQIKECLELSMQLYIMSSLLEIYYAQNYDLNYIHYVEDNVVIYIDKCEKRMLSIFSKLYTYVHDFKENMLKKIDKPALENQINNVINTFSEGTESELRKSFRQVLHSQGKKSEYYLSSNGDVYLKTV